MLNIVKAYGIINALLAAIIALCTIALLAIVFTGLCFLFGF